MFHVTVCRATTIKLFTLVFEKLPAQFLPNARNNFGTGLLERLDLLQKLMNAEISPSSFSFFQLN